MLENAGAKLKVLAKIIVWFGIIAAFIIGFIVMYGMTSLRYIISHDEMIWMGVLIIIIGSVGSWISALFIYAFGDISEQTEAIRETLDTMQADENPKYSR